MGAVIWQLNDCWPGISWSSIDYGGRWKALHYASKRFFNPILASVAENGSKAEIHVGNETRQTFNGRLAWKLRGPGKTVLRKGRKTLHCDPMSTCKLLELDFSDILGPCPANPVSPGIPPLSRGANARQCYLEYVLSDAKGEVHSQGICLFVPAKFFELKEPCLELRFESSVENPVIALRSEELARFVEIDFEGFDAILEDNYFDLVPGETRRILIKAFRGKRPAHLEDLADAIRIRSLHDSWHHDEA
jgi:beta-mannosidase